MLTAKGRTRIWTDIWYRKGPSINVNNTLCTNPLFLQSALCRWDSCRCQISCGTSANETFTSRPCQTHTGVKTVRKFPFCQEGWQRSSYENRDSHKRMWTIPPAEDYNLVSVTFFFTASKSTAGVDVSKVRRAFHFSLIKHLGYLRHLKRGISWIKTVYFHTYISTVCSTE